MKNVIRITLLLALISCGRVKEKKNVKVNDFYKPAYTDTQLSDKLKLALTQPKDLAQIFIDWNAAIKPNTEDYINQNDTINAVFNVYKTFYKPFDLLKIGDWEWGNKLNSDCKYAVIQNKIFYFISLKANLDDFNWEKSKIDSITNFRPPTALPKNKVLYLTDEYKKSINKFLGTESTNVGEGDIMNPAMPKGQSEKRYELLRPFIPILQGHWGGYWHLSTHPELDLIIFNKSLTKATINFRVGFQGGKATLVNDGNSWTIKESKATWIE